MPWLTWKLIFLPSYRSTTITPCVPATTRGKSFTRTDCRSSEWASGFMRKREPPKKNMEEMRQRDVQKKARWLRHYPLLMQYRLYQFEEKVFEWLTSNRMVEFEMRWLEMHEGDALNSWPILLNLLNEQEQYLTTFYLFLSLPSAWCFFKISVALSYTIGNSIKIIFHNAGISFRPSWWNRKLSISLKWYPVNDGRVYSTTLSPSPSISSIHQTSQLTTVPK